MVTFKFACLFVKGIASKQRKTQWMHAPTEKEGERGVAKGLDSHAQVTCVTLLQNFHDFVLKC